MARKMVSKILNTGLAYNNSTVTSNWIQTDALDIMGFQVIFSSAPTTAALTIDVSYDPVDDSNAYNASGTPASPTNVDTATTTSVSANGKTIVSYDMTSQHRSATWMRARIAVTTGTGTATVTFCGKSSGG